MALRFSELASAFVEHATRVLAPRTVEFYQHFFRRWISTHGDSVISELQARHLLEFGKTWHATHSIKRLFAWAHLDAGLIERNPFQRVKLPRKGGRRRIARPSEIVRVLRTVKHDLRCLLIALRETMARPQELRGARWEDIVSDDPRAELGEALRSGQASIVLYKFKLCERRSDQDRPRIILLSPRVCRLLLRLYARSETRTGPIFLTAFGRAWTANALRCRFRRLRQRLGIQRDSRGETIVPYTFRHTGATVAASLGVRDRLLADALGHVETKTTGRYCHLQLGHLREAFAGVWKRHRKK